jgi:hypothetical protein
MDNEALLLLDAGDNEIKRCDTSIMQCSPLIEGSAEQTTVILSFAFAPEVNRLYLATGGGHKVTVYDLQGRKLYTLKVPKGVKYVNDMQWLGDNRLLVTDTNHHRVIELLDLGEGEVEVIQQLEAKNALGREGRKWPTDAKRDLDGGTWVINSNGMLSNGDLIFYDPSGEAHKLIELDDDAELNALTLYPEGVLVSDSQKSQLTLVSSRDFSITQLDQDSLQETLRTISQQRSLWQTTYNIGLVVLILSISTGVIAGYLDWKTRKKIDAENPIERPTFVDGEWIIPPEIKARVSPDADGVYWLTIKPESLKTFKAIALLMPVGLIWMFYITFSNKDFGLHSPLLLSLMMVIFLLSVMIWFFYIALPRLRIGTDGRSLFMIDYLGRKASALPDKCIRTPNRLMIGKQAAPIKQHGPILFDKELFSLLIEPMLSQVPKTNEFELMWRNLRSGDPATWLGLIAIALLLLKDIWF